MFTIIGADGKEYGPVSADKLREWVAAGRANAQTQCKREGETAWSTLGSLPEFAASLASAPPPVQAAPVYSAPATAAAPADPQGIANHAIAHGRVRVFECIGKGFNTWTSHFLPLVGVTALVTIVMFVMGMIPLVGTLSQLLLTGAFYAGLYYYYLGKIRGEPREVGDAFAGFSRALGPLVLCNLLQSAILIVLMLVFMAPVVGALFTAAMSRGAEHVVFPTLAPFAIGALAIGGLLMIFIAVALLFAYALIVDKGLGPWDAIVVSWRVVIRNWFSVFFVTFISALLCSLGLIALIIGIFLTMPIFYASVMHAYESLFNPPGAPHSA